MTPGICKLYNTLCASLEYIDITFALEKLRFKNIVAIMRYQNNW